MTEPKADLPLPAEVTSYIASVLRAYGVTPSKAWIKADGLHPDALFVANFPGAVQPARDSIPKSNAVWESSAFFRPAILLAIDFIRQGPVERYEEFEVGMIEILGDSVRPWLPSLFLAASASPSISVEFRRKLVGRFNLDRLDVEQEAEDRRSLQQDDD